MKRYTVKTESGLLLLDSAVEAHIDDCFREHRRAGRRVIKGTYRVR